jgi:hypothetical protein
VTDDISKKEEPKEGEEPMRLIPPPLCPAVLLTNELLKKEECEPEDRQRAPPSPAVFILYIEE